MKNLIAAVTAAVSAVGSTLSFAQTSGGMSHDAMLNEMSKDAMSHDHMRDAEMSHDKVGQGSKDPPSGAMAQ